MPVQSAWPRNALTDWLIAAFGERSLRAYNLRQPAANRFRKSLRVGPSSVPSGKLPDVVGSPQDESVRLADWQPAPPENPRDWRQSRICFTNAPCFFVPQPRGYSESFREQAAEPREVPFHRNRYMVKWLQRYIVKSRLSVARIHSTRPRLLENPAELGDRR
jgi:hypothetical protein